MNDLLIPRRLIELVDSHTPDPVQRAQKVLEYLKKSDLDDYDIQSFCVQFLTGRAYVDMEYVKQEIIRINRLFLYAHYQKEWNTLQTDVTIQDTTSSGPSQPSSESSPQK